MAFVDVLGTGFLAVMGTVFLRLAVRSWRHGYSFGHRMRLVLLPDDFKTGLERAFAAASSFFYLMSATGVADLSIPPQEAGTPAWAGVLVGVLIVSVLLNVAVMFSIVWFNRPRCFVPPHMRRQRGTMNFR